MFYRYVTTDNVPCIFEFLDAGFDQEECASKIYRLHDYAGYLPGKKIRTNFGDFLELPYSIVDKLEPSFQNELDELALSNVISYTINSLDNNGLMCNFRLTEARREQIKEYRRVLKQYRGK
jgi:hypothetical protein